jgi:hypothetical protein
MMKERKVESGPVDAERVVHELLDALETLAKKRRFTRSLANDHEGASTKVFASTGKVPGLGESEPEQIPAFESAENSQPPGFEAHSSEDGVIQGFCRAHGVVERLRVTPQELQALADASLLGSLTCKEDVLFMLRQIHGARTHAEPEASAAPQQIRAQHLFGESEANGHPLEDEPNKTREFNSARANHSSPLASPIQQPVRREYRGSNLHWNTTGAKAAILISIVSLFLSVLTLAVLYQTFGILRRHASLAATPIATPAATANQQPEITAETLSALQAQATAAKLASQAAQSQADSAKLQADAAALSAHNARDIFSVAEAADVDVEAIYCSPRGAFSRDTTVTLRYRNSGRTRADNFESSFSYGIPATRSIEKTKVQSDDADAASLSAGASTPSGTTATVGDVLSKNPGSIPPEQTFQKIIAGQLKFGIWGYVRYTDVLGEKHQKNFDYVWDSNFPDACLFTEARTSAQ